MTALDWMVAAAVGLTVAWAVTAAVVILGDRRDRKAYEHEEARREWREFVDAMRRIEQQQSDDWGSA